MRFAPHAVDALDEILRGAPVGADPTAQHVARVLLDAGAAHPVPERRRGAGADRLTVVVPHRDHHDALDELLDALAGASGLEPDRIVVVDDASERAGVEVVVGGRARLVTRSVRGGPAAARNTGWRSTTTELVAFVDSDVLPTPRWIEPLVALLDDPAVGMVAPRVTTRSDRTASLLERYETARSPLDLGPSASPVGIGRRVTYVPGAALLARRTLLDDLDGFDEDLSTGEDVDAVWRAAATGWTVRYEPTSVVHHRPRRTWAALLRQRWTYGRAAAALDARHPGAAAPVTLDPTTAAAWTLAIAAGPLGAVGGLVVVAGATGVLGRRLRGRVDHPMRTAARIAGRGSWAAGPWLAQAIRRGWYPVLLGLGARRRRARRALVLAFCAPIVAGRDPESVGRLFSTAIGAVDDAAYGAGVWAGAWERRSVRCLLPRLTSAQGLARGRATGAVTTPTAR